MPVYGRIRHKKIERSRIEKKTSPQPNNRGSLIIDQRLTLCQGKKRGGYYKKKHVCKVFFELFCMGKHVTEHLFLSLQYGPENSRIMYLCSTFSHLRHFVYYYKLNT